MTVDLPYPPSINHYYTPIVIAGRSRKIVSKRGRAWKLEAVLMVRTAARSKLEGDVAVRIEVYPPDRRARDIDNIIKPILDACTEGGAWEDDSQVARLEVVRMPVEKGGRVRVTVEGIE